MYRTQAAGLMHKDRGRLCTKPTDHPLRIHKCKGYLGDLARRPSHPRNTWFVWIFSVYSRQRSGQRHDYVVGRGQCRDTAEITPARRDATMTKVVTPPMPTTRWSMGPNMRAHGDRDKKARFREIRKWSSEGDYFVSETRPPRQGKVHVVRTLGGEGVWWTERPRASTCPLSEAHCQHSRSPILPERGKVITTIGGTASMGSERMPVLPTRCHSRNLRRNPDSRMSGKSRE